MIHNIQRLINSANSITFVTGAGVSVSAGIPDFQTVDQNWHYEEDRYSVMSAPFFKQNPVRFWEIYKELQKPVKNAKPTDFHLWVAELELTKQINIVTQNTDSLHSNAGSSQVLEIHGNSSTLLCVEEQVIFSSKFFKKQKTPTCPRCNQTLKPDVSLFFEGIQHSYTARNMIRFSDLLIVAGTSLQTGPLNEMVLQELIRGKRSIWINKNVPPDDYEFDYSYIGETEDFVRNI